MVGFAVQTADVIAKQDLASLLSEEWSDLHDLTVTSDLERAVVVAVLSSPSDTFIEVRSSDPRGMGFGLTGAAFLVTVKAALSSIPPELVAKGIETVLTAVLKELVTEAFKRIRRRRGDRYVDVRELSED